MPGVGIPHDTCQLRGRRRLVNSPARVRRRHGLQGGKLRLDLHITEGRVRSRQRADADKTRAVSECASAQTTRWSRPTVTASGSLSCARTGVGPGSVSGYSIADHRTPALGGRPPPALAGCTHRSANDADRTVAAHSQRLQPRVHPQWRHGWAARKWPACASARRLVKPTERAQSALATCRSRALAPVNTAGHSGNGRRRLIVGVGDLRTRPSSGETKTSCSVRRTPAAMLRADLRSTDVSLPLIEHLPFEDGGYPVGSQRDRFPGGGVRQLPGPPAHSAARAADSRGGQPGRVTSERAFFCRPGIMARALVVWPMFVSLAGVGVSYLEECLCTGIAIRAGAARLFMPGLRKVPTRVGTRYSSPFGALPSGGRLRRSGGAASRSRVEYIGRPGTLTSTSSGRSRRRLNPASLGLMQPSAAMQSTVNAGIAGRRRPERPPTGMFDSAQRLTMKPGARAHSLEVSSRITRHGHAARGSSSHPA